MNAAIEMMRPMPADWGGVTPASMGQSERAIVKTARKLDRPLLVLPATWTDQEKWAALDQFLGTNSTALKGGVAAATGGASCTSSSCSGAGRRRPVGSGEEVAGGERGGWQRAWSVVGPPERGAPRSEVSEARSSSLTKRARHEHRDFEEVCFS